MHTAFSFLVLHGANLETASREFGCFREGDYLCDSCSGWTETVGTSFCHSSPSRKSGGGEDSLGTL